jgi:hypothetical protein
MGVLSADGFLLMPSLSSGDGPDLVEKGRANRMPSWVDR